MTRDREQPRVELGDLEEIEIAEWIHFVQEWREALAADTAEEA